MFNESDADVLMDRLAASVLHFRITDTAIEFRARPIDVIKAEYVTNEILACCGTAAIYDFMSHLGIDEDDMSIPIDSGCDPLMQGWCMDCFDAVDSPWLEFIHSVAETSQGLEIVISFGIPPCGSMDDCRGFSTPNCLEREMV